MRVFVSEFVVGGASLGMNYPKSMQREGLAMLDAITKDLSRIPRCQVITTLERNLNLSSQPEVIWIEKPAQEFSVFQQLLTEVDAVLIIAPETDGILAERVRWVVESGVPSWNCSPVAIDLCSDKLRLASHLYWLGVPTIPTQEVDLSIPPDTTSWPVVLKPRDGAGSNLTFLIRNSNGWDLAVDQIRLARSTEKMIVQPFIEGQPLSIGVNRCFDSERIGYLPVGQQLLSEDGRFQYLGGRIPANISDGVSSQIEEIVSTLCRSIPGLAGYFGIDLLLTEDSRPLIVEINPRLTTSYIGYRQLFETILPERWFVSNDSKPLIPRSPGFVEFDVSEMLNSI